MVVVTYTKSAVIGGGIFIYCNSHFNVCPPSNLLFYITCHIEIAGGQYLLIPADGILNKITKNIGTSRK